MPVLNDLRKKVEVKLPVTGGKVLIYDHLLASDSLAIEECYVSDVSLTVNTGTSKAQDVSLRAARYYKAMDITLRAMVAEWDFTDEDGGVLKPTLENLKKLPVEDFNILMEEVNKYSGNKRVTKEEKKD